MKAHNIALIWGLVSFASASLYYLISKRQKKSYKNCGKGPCPGLLNLGNTCFLNSVLQALSPCKSFITWLEYVLDSSYFMNRNSLVLDVYAMMKILNNESIEHADTCNPKPILDNLYAKGWVISREEHDACELFHVLMESLNEEQLNNPPIIPLFDMFTLQAFKSLPKQEAINKINTDLPKLNSSLSSPSSYLSSSSSLPPCYGRLASQLICKGCGQKVPMNYQKFCTLSLPLPCNQQFASITLESLLKNFLMSETVTGMNCTKCKLTGPFIKKNIIGKLPSCLCIHIQRTIWLPYGPLKRDDPVVFPDYVDMSKFLWPNSCYDLASVAGNGVKGQGHWGSNGTSAVLFGNVFGSNAGKFGLLGGKVKPDKIDDGIGSKDLLKSEKLADLKSPVKSIRKVTRVKNPYSVSVNMWKALNYYSHLSHLGIQNASTSLPLATTTTTDSPSSQTSSTGFKTMVPPPSYKEDSDLSKALSTLVKAYKNDSYCCKKGNKEDHTRNCMFRLSSVIVHHGDVMSGHFVTYKRAPSRFGVQFPNSWVYTSDSHVREAGPQEVYLSKAYMLIYERL